MGRHVGATKRLKLISAPCSMHLCRHCCKRMCIRSARWRRFRWLNAHFGIQYSCTKYSFCVFLPPGMHRPTTSQQQEERLEERAQGKEGEEEKPEEEKLVTRTCKRRKVKLDPAELQAFIASTDNYIEDAKKFQEFYAEQELLASQHYQDARYKALAQLATDTTRRNNRVRELQEELQVTSKSGASASSSSSLGPSSRRISAWQGCSVSAATGLKGCATVRSLATATARRPASTSGPLPTWIAGKLT